MKVIIAGSRNVDNAVNHVGWAVYHSGFQITTVVSGTARGIDQAGETYANHYKIPLIRFPAEWDIHGKSAGYKRNVMMAENADALIAIWDGQSRGTKHMIDIAKSKGLKVFIYDPLTAIGHHE